MSKTNPRTCSSCTPYHSTFSSRYNQPLRNHSLLPPPPPPPTSRSHARRDPRTSCHVRGRFVKAPTHLYCTAPYGVCICIYTHTLSPSLSLPLSLSHFLSLSLSLSLSHRTGAAPPRGWRIKGALATHENRQSGKSAKVKEWGRGGERGRRRETHNRRLHGGEEHDVGASSSLT
jgi:hypothetical protein